MKCFTFLFIALMSANMAFTQIIAKQIKYQVALRDAGGNIIASQPKTLIINILNGSANGISVFSETQNVTTTAQGIVDLNIGCINTTGINTINWASGPYFIKITVDGVVLGISQVLSVPNALFPDNTANWNINYPEGINGEIINKRLDPNGYKVPEGKTLYIHTANSFANNNRFSIDEYCYVVLNAGCLNFSCPLIVKGGSFITSGANLFITGILVNSQVDIINKRLDNGYKVPEGKTLYIHTANSFANNNRFSIDGLCYIVINVGCQNFFSPLLVKGGSLITSEANIFITGYLK